LAGLEAAGAEVVVGPAPIAQDAQAAKNHAATTKRIDNFPNDFFNDETLFTATSFPVE
jgi:hypothetical protein